MPAYRLKQDDRDTIAGRASGLHTNKSHEEFTENARILDALARRIYADKYDAKTRAKLKRLPAGWVPHFMAFRVGFGDRYISLNLIGKERLACKWSDSRHSNGCFASYDAQHKFSREYINHEEAANAKYAKRQVQWQEIRAVLGTFKTLENLMTGWPEMIPYVKGIGAGIPSSVAVVDFDKLNERLGLPRAEQVTS